MQIINDKCPHIRLDHNDAPRKLKIEGSEYSYELSYCYVSQRGYYPNGLLSLSLSAKFYFHSTKQGEPR